MDDVVVDGQVDDARCKQAVVADAVRQHNVTQTRRLFDVQRDPSRLEDDPPAERERESQKFQKLNTARNAPTIKTPFIHKNEHFAKTGSGQT
jgi:hypothetical protein